MDGPCLPEARKQHGASSSSWEAHFDPVEQAHYYHNESTGEVTWSKPSGDTLSGGADSSEAGVGGADCQRGRPGGDIFPVSSFCDFMTGICAAISLVLFVLVYSSSSSSKIPSDWDHTRGKNNSHCCVWSGKRQSFAGAGSAHWATQSLVGSMCILSVHWNHRSLRRAPNVPKRFYKWSSRIVATALVIFCAANVVLQPPACLNAMPETPSVCFADIRPNTTMDNSTERSTRSPCRKINARYMESCGLKTWHANVTPRVLHWDRTYFLANDEASQDNASTNVLSFEDALETVESVSQKLEDNGALDVLLGSTEWASRGFAVNSFARYILRYTCLGEIIPPCEPLACDPQMYPCTGCPVAFSRYARDIAAAKMRASTGLDSFDDVVEQLRTRNGPVYAYVRTFVIAKEWRGTAKEDFALSLLDRVLEEAARLYSHGTRGGLVDVGAVDDFVQRSCDSSFATRSVPLRSNYSTYCSLPRAAMTRGVGWPGKQQAVPTLLFAPLPASRGFGSRVYVPVS